MRTLPRGCGTAFKLDPSGKESVLHAFTGGSDGKISYGGLISDAAGNLYGTTVIGGNTSCDPNFGCGVVFKLNPAGNETVLHTFGTQRADGQFSVAGLVRDAEGNLYGTTNEGGSNSSPCRSSYGFGVVFKLDATGQHYKLLHTFTGGTDGGSPYAGLIIDSAGNLYGTTQVGGYTGGSCPNGSQGCGVVFKLDPLGNETVLYSFTGGADGFQPQAGLWRDAVGNPYGTTPYGGDFSRSCSPSGCGVVFKLDTAGNETVLHAFSYTDGALPLAGVIPDATGNLYGTTWIGGAYGYGVVLKLH